MARTQVRVAVLSGTAVLAFFLVPVIGLWRTNASLTDRIRNVCDPSSPGNIRSASPNPNRGVMIPTSSPDRILRIAEQHAGISAAERNRLLATFGEDAGSARNELHRVLLVQWAEEDGEAAAEWMRQEFSRIGDSPDGNGGKGANELRSAMKDVLST